MSKNINKTEKTYFYRGKMYCEKCGEGICAQLVKHNLAPANMADGFSYTSQDFPKGPWAPRRGDLPHFCASGHNCLSRLRTASGKHYGAWLHTPLTPDGISYVCDILRTGDDFSIIQLYSDLYPECKKIIIQEYVNENSDMPSV